MTPDDFGDDVAMTSGDIGTWNSEVVLILFDSGRFAVVSK